MRRMSLQFGSPRRAVPVLAGVLALIAGACSNDAATDGAASSSSGRDGAIAAQVASYDLVAGRTGRFIVGLFGSDRTRTVAFGTVTFSFAHLDGDQRSPESEPVTATFLPIPGQDVDLDQPGPRLVGASEATGVYGAADVTFDEAGFWEVTVTARVDGNDETTAAAFEVLGDSAIPAVGDPAPRTDQPLAGDLTVDPEAVDSRASKDRPVPDPALHDLTVTGALDAGRPFMVVVSTPTFCVSRFCGPITDSVQALAVRFADTPMAFIHLEVWENFETNTVNAAAREWVAPTPDTDGAEPWVFVVNADGIITRRFDNVATDAELLDAVEVTLGS